MSCTPLYRHKKAGISPIIYPPRTSPASTSALPTGTGSVHISTHDVLLLGVPTPSVPTPTVPHSYHTRTNVSAGAIKSAELDAAIPLLCDRDPNYNLIYCKLCNSTLTSTECTAVYRHMEDKHAQALERICSQWSTPQTSLGEWKDALFQRFQNWKITEHSELETKQYLMGVWAKTGKTPIAHPLAEPYPSPRSGRLCRFCPALIVGQLRSHMISKHSSKYELGMPISEMDGGSVTVQKLDLRHRVRVEYWRTPNERPPLPAGRRRSAKSSGSASGSGDSDDSESDGDYTPSFAPRHQRKPGTARAGIQPAVDLGTAETLATLPPPSSLVPLPATATSTSTPAPVPTPTPTPTPTPAQTVASTAATPTTTTVTTSTASDRMDVDDRVVVQSLLAATEEMPAPAASNNPPLPVDQEEPKLSREAVEALKILPRTAPAHYYASATRFPVIIEKPVLRTQDVAKVIRSDVRRVVKAGDLSDVAIIVYFTCKYPQIPAYFVNSAIVEARMTPTPAQPTAVAPSGSREAAMIVD